MRSTMPKNVMTTATRSTTALPRAMARTAMSTRTTSPGRQSAPATMERCATSSGQRCRTISFKGRAALLRSSTAVVSISSSARAIFAGRSATSITRRSATASVPAATTTSANAPTTSHSTQRAIGTSSAIAAVITSKRESNGLGRMCGVLSC